MPLGTLPPHGQVIWEEVYQSARSRGASESSAAKQAWSVVKVSYRKKGGIWVPKKHGKKHHAARGRVFKT